MDTYAIDFETYYDKVCSIKSLGTRGYFSHPEFDCYMVSVAGGNGFEFVGNPRDFDWSRLAGNVVLSHNASFDQLLYLFGAESGWWDLVGYKEWHCTADLAAYCGHPRNLKGAVSEVLSEDISKETRANMMGKRWDKMTPEFQEEVLEYAMSDSLLCLRLWEALSQQWPEHERELSALTRKSVAYGLPIDTDLLKKQIESINQRLFDVENSIPWIDHSPPLSRVAFDNQCREIGLEPPDSLALSDENANAWIKKHGKEYAWIGAVRNFRRINSVKRKLESFDRATMPDGRFYGGLMYFGAHTGRWSGSGGISLNLQNLPRGEMFGVNLRSLIAPKEGNVLVVADLSQIEVRTLCWLAGDHALLDIIRHSDDFYQAFAEWFGMWGKTKGALKDINPKLRHRVKTMVLGCGYGAGPSKFAMISDMDETEAEEAVRLYRDRMFKVVGYWNKLTRDMGASEGVEGGKYFIELPSGRRLNYGRLQTLPRKFHGRDYFTELVKGSARRKVKLYGGLLAENASQALARDVFADIMLRLDKEGHKIICHVHDEVVIEVKEDDAERVLGDVLKTMQTPPTWLPDIPLDAEGKILKRYEK